MKTLIITCIYSNLWGTEFGGRPSRNHHYKLSLLNILKMSPSKCICFTSEEEKILLEDFFYKNNNLNKNQIEFRIFDLQNTKYFNEIKDKKNIEEMKKTDRCYEIQYNKFLWTSDIVDIKNYDRVYWFDAGLSHAGIFPKQYTRDGSFDGHYNVTLFTPEYLEYLNKLTEEKLIIISKNNTGSYYWSRSLPACYYDKFDKSEHIVGGFFGGTPEKYIELSNKFESLLSEVLKKEDELYMEELLMSCLYFNDQDYFKVLKFDDWYKRENHNDLSIRYFYHIFLSR
jgi:hypothetical protein